MDVEGESGILRALGTTPGEVKHGTSRMVEYAHRSYGEIGLRNGHIIYVDSADDGALRIQGKNLRAIWADEIGLWQRWQVAWDESIRYAVRKGASKIIATGTPKVCFAVAQPKGQTPKKIKRGPVYFYISRWPADGVTNEVSVKMGYPFGDGAKATLTVGTAKFDLFTKDEGAFVEKTDVETRLVDALKKASTMKIDGKSTRGTATSDVYSLDGFSDALARIAKECSS